MLTSLVGAKERHTEQFIGASIDPKRPPGKTLVSLLFRAFVALKSDGTLEHVQAMANQSSARTTKLYAAPIKLHSTGTSAWGFE